MICQSLTLLLMDEQFQHYQRNPGLQMSGLQKLVEILQKIPTSPKPSPEKASIYKAYLTKQEIRSIRQKAKRQFRMPWRGNSIQERTTKYKAIRGKCLSNWEIDRILISDRSFSRNLKSVKAPAACNEFQKITAKDKDGHLPYLYESSLPKIQRIQSELYRPSFKPGSETADLFGMKESSRMKESSQAKSYSSRILQRREFWLT